MTWFPISACWMLTCGPMLQFRPIWHPAAIVAPLAITVPAPTATSGPITAKGSTVTPASSRAEGWTLALIGHATGRETAARCQGVGIERPARERERNRRTLRKNATTPSGTKAAKRGAVMTTPARVSFSAASYRSVSKKLTSSGPADPATRYRERFDRRTGRRPCRHRQRKARQGSCPCRAERTKWPSEPCLSPLRSATRSRTRTPGSGRSLPSPAERRS